MSGKRARSSRMTSGCGGSPAATAAAGGHCEGCAGPAAIAGVCSPPTSDLVLRRQLVRRRDVRPAHVTQREPGRLLHALRTDDPAERPALRLDLRLKQEEALHKRCG